MLADVMLRGRGFRSQNMGRINVLAMQLRVIGNEEAKMRYKYRGCIVSGRDPIITLKCTAVPRIVPAARSICSAKQGMDKILRNT
jgi:hypothetical protein